jgi:hypothetical protein
MEEKILFSWDRFSTTLGHIRFYCDLLWFKSNLPAELYLHRQMFRPYGTEGIVDCRLDDWTIFDFISAAGK